MKQFIILDHNLNMKDVVITDTTPKVFDCIVPQKTTLTFFKDIKISEEDICIIRDAKTRNVEYLGIVDTIEKDTTTRVAILPFIAICDNDLKVSTLNATESNETSVQDWITEQITNNFINTSDVLSKFAITIRDNTTNDIYYKAVKETNNLLDALNEIYLNTGLYIDFNVSYNNGVVDKLYCDIFNANEQPSKQIRFDNPQIVNKVSSKFSQYGNYSKCIINVGTTGRSFEFYLRNDNKITTNPEDEQRIRKVKTKIVDLTASYGSEEQLAEGLVLLAQKTLCGDAFAYSIEFNILKTAITDWRFRQKCKFLAPDRIYESYITNIEYLNDEEAKITLGAYRYTLTDKFKHLIRQPNEIGNTFNGISLSSGLGSTTFWFTQESGDLYLNYPEDEEEPIFYIEDGDLIVEYENDEPDFEIENDGELVYKY